MARPDPRTDPQAIVFCRAIVGQPVAGAAAAPNILITFPFSLDVPGGGSVGCVQIARHLAAAGARVELALVDTQIADRRLLQRPPDGTGIGTQGDALCDAGVDVVAIAPHRVHPFFDALPMRRHVAARLAQRHFDAVLGWHHEFGLLPTMLHRAGIVAGAFASGRYHHLESLHRYATRPKTLLHRCTERALVGRSLRGADVVFAISGFTRDVVVRALGVQPSRVAVVPWGVDRAFGEAAAADGCDGEAEPVRRFVFFGSPDRRKGGFETLDAFAELARRGCRDWSLTVVWAHGPEIARRAAELGIADRVAVRPPMDHRSLAAELARAQVAVLPSKFESFGLACAEALATGRPVIACDVGGVAEVIEHGATGWVVPAACPELLVGALCDAMADPDRTAAMGRQARAASGRYDWSRTVAEIFELLGRAAARQ